MDSESARTIGRLAPRPLLARFVERRARVSSGRPASAPRRHAHARPQLDAIPRRGRSTRTRSTRRERARVSRDSTRRARRRPRARGTTAAVFGTRGRTTGHDPCHTPRVMSRRRVPTLAVAVASNPRRVRHTAPTLSRARRRRTLARGRGKSLFVARARRARDFAREDAREATEGDDRARSPSRAVENGARRTRGGARGMKRRRGRVVGGCRARTRGMRRRWMCCGCVRMSDDATGTAATRGADEG